MASSAGTAADKAKPLIAKGMAFADTARAVAAQSEIVFSSSTDGTAVRAVALGDDGIIAGLRRRWNRSRHEHDCPGR